MLNSARFQDQAPRQVDATLLDEEIYLCSWSTMYRILRRHDEVRERRNQLRHPAYTKPELLATAPRQLWSWDITTLKGVHPWTYYYLYLLMDVFSRYVVGWMVMEREAASLAEALIAETCAKEGIMPDQRTLHADRGSSMSSKTVVQLLADLGVTKTHSRPHVSNDNPYSEAQFKTLKYRHDYPQVFGSLEDARAWTRSFVAWYNYQHYHTVLGLLTPAVVHHGLGGAVRAKRQAVLGGAGRASRTLCAGCPARASRANRRLDQSSASEDGAQYCWGIGCIWFQRDTLIEAPVTPVDVVSIWLTHTETRLPGVKDAPTNVCNGASPGDTACLLPRSEQQMALLRWCWSKIGAVW
jgi:putative transposase